MAADNESQGLKIAVAAFITLTVILGVSSYFLYANVASAQARLDSEGDAHKNTREALTKAKRMAHLALTQYDEMRTRIGTKAVEFDPAMDEISANFKKVEERLNSLSNTVDAAVRTAQQNGAQGPELEELKVNVQNAIAWFRSEPNKNYISSLNRLSELMENLALLTTRISLKHADVKKSAGASTSDAKGQKDQGQKTKD